MPLPRKFATIYLTRPWRARASNNNKAVSIHLDAAIRVRAFLYNQGNLLANLGFTNQPTPSSDTPPQSVNFLTYKNDKAAARSGWIGEVGFILVRTSAPATNENNKEGNPEPNPVISREKSSVYYTFDKQLTYISGILYGMTWDDPILTGATYKVQPGSIHQIKHRNTTPYF